MIVSLIVFVIILVLALPAAIVLIPLALVTGHVGPLYAAGCFIARTAIRVAGIRIRVQGQENIPAGRACIFMANHVSNLDPPVLLANLPGRTSVFLKRLADEDSYPRLCLQAGRIHSGGARGQRGNRAAECRPGPPRARPGDCTSPHLLRACALSTAACCPSRKARSTWPWNPARRAFPYRSTGRRRSFPGAAGAFTPEPRTSSFIRRSIRPNYATREELSEAVRAAIASACRSGCGARIVRVILESSKARSGTRTQPIGAAAQFAGNSLTRCPTVELPRCIRRSAAYCANGWLRRGC